MKILLLPLILPYLVLFLLKWWERLHRVQRLNLLLKLLSLAQRLPLPKRWKHNLLLLQLKL